MAKTLQKTKLVFKDVCNPKKIAADFKGGEEVVGGTIIGLVTGVHRGIAKARDGLTDVETVGLKGNFEGVPTDPAGTTVQSGIMYMPAAFQGPLVDIMEVPAIDDKGKPILNKAGFPTYERNPNWDGAPIQVAAEIIVTHATNPQGYSWAVIPAADLTKQVDPLAEVRAAMAQKRLPAPSAEEKPADAPAAKGKQKQSA